MMIQECLYVSRNGLPLEQYLRFNRGTVNVYIGYFFHRFVFQNKKQQQTKTEKTKGGNGVFILFYFNGN